MLRSVNMELVGGINCVFVALPQVDDDLHDRLLSLSRELHGRPGVRKTCIESLV